MKLIRASFEERELRTSNVYGRKGKLKLDAARTASVREIVYKYWPLKPGTNEDQDWNKNCVKAIDEANRRLNRGKTKKTTGSSSD